MDPLFKISSPEDKNSAFFHLLIEIYAQNSVMTELVAKTYAKVTDQDFDKVAAMCQKNFENQKKKILSSIRTLFGDLGLDDILAGGKL